MLFLWIKIDNFIKKYFIAIKTFKKCQKKDFLSIWTGSFIQMKP